MPLGVRAVQRAIKKESDLPPSEQESFKMMFTPNQPRLCRECVGALPAGYQGNYCSNRCETAGTTYHCRKCEIPRSTKSDDPYCPTCKVGGRAWKSDINDNQLHKGCQAQCGNITFSFRVCTQMLRRGVTRRMSRLGRSARLLRLLARGRELLLLSH